MYTHAHFAALAIALFSVHTGNVVSSAGSCAMAQYSWRCTWRHWAKVKVDVGKRLLLLNVGRVKLWEKDGCQKFKAVMLARGGERLCGGRDAELLPQVGFSPPKGWTALPDPIGLHRPSVVETWTFSRLGQWVFHHLWRAWVSVKCRNYQSKKWLNKRSKLFWTQPWSEGRQLPSPHIPTSMHRKSAPSVNPGLAKSSHSQNIYLYQSLWVWIIHYALHLFAFKILGEFSVIPQNPFL